MKQKNLKLIIKKIKKNNPKIFKNINKHKILSFNLIQNIIKYRIKNILYKIYLRNRKMIKKINLRIILA
jgi:hypothetical protein